MCRELCQETALSYAGFAGHEHEGRPAIRCSTERLVEPIELGATTDEDRAADSASHTADHAATPPVGQCPRASLTHTPTSDLGRRTPRRVVSSSGADLAQMSVTVRDFLPDL